MQTENFLREITAVPGLSGNEAAVARAIADAFRPENDPAEDDEHEGFKVVLAAADTFRAADRR